MNSPATPNSSATHLPTGSAARASGPPVDRPGVTEAPHLGPPPGEGDGVAPWGAGTRQAGTRGARPTTGPSSEGTDDGNIRHLLRSVGVDPEVLALSILLKLCVEEHHHDDPQIDLEAALLLAARMHTDADVRHGYNDRPPGPRPSFQGPPEPANAPTDHVPALPGQCEGRTTHDNARGRRSDGDG